MAAKSKSKTGMEEMLGKLFNSPGLAGAAESMDRVQAAPVAIAPTPISIPIPESPSPIQSLSTKTSDGTLNETSHATTDATYDDLTHETLHGPSHDALDDATDRTSDVPPKTAERQTERDTKRDTVVTDERLSTRQTAHNEPRQTEQLTQRDTERYTPRQTERVTYHSDPIMTLTVRQGMCLYYLLQRPDYIAQRHTMGEALNLPLPTIRDCITVLVRERFISKPQKIVIRSFQGFTYRLADEDQCARFMRLRGEEFANVIERNTGRDTLRLTDRLTIRQTNTANNVMSNGTSDELPPFSSSRKEEKLTTTENLEIDDLLRDPELGYWRGKGVNARQITLWSEEFQMPIDQVIQSLKYCRFEMVVLNLEEEKQIAKPENWFYKIVQKSGVYPKPTNYKSLAEIRAEQMEQAAREAAGARERQRAAEQELSFQRILSDPDSAEYQKLFEQISDFARDMGGKAMETALREAFDQQPKGDTP